MKVVPAEYVPRSGPLLMLMVTGEDEPAVMLKFVSSVLLPSVMETSEVTLPVLVGVPLTVPPVLKCKSVSNACVALNV